MAGVTRKGTSHLQTYISLIQKSLKNLSLFFPNLKLLDTFDCVGHPALWAFIKNSLSLSCFRVWYYQWKSVTENPHHLLWAIHYATSPLAPLVRGSRLLRLRLQKKMAYAIIKRCGRVLWFILFVIQLGTFVFFQLMGLLNSGWLHSDLEHVAIIVFFLLYFIIVSILSEILLLVATKSDGFILPQLFFGWKLYIGFVFVPNVMGIFGGIAVYKAEDLQTSGINSLTLTVCATPILLLLLLITADDSFSSRSHKDLVRNLSILMVSDLIDGIEMLDSTLKGNSYGIHKSFLTLGAVMIIVLSSFQMAEYKFVRGELMEQPIYTTTVIRHICVIILNLAFLIVRVKVSRSILIIFKNCMAIILSVIQISYLTQHTWNLYDLN